MTDKFKPVTWQHFDNSDRFQVFSDGDGHYQVRNSVSGNVVIETIAADYAAMKCKEANRADYYVQNF